MSAQEPTGNACQLPSARIWYTREKTAPRSDIFGALTQAENGGLCGGSLNMAMRVRV